MGVLVLKKRLPSLFVALLMAAGGCTMVTYNRTFPKAEWYWSKEAREQRREKAKEREYERALWTNSISDR